jgi:lantibiotic modifying enzyme
MIAMRWWVLWIVMATTVAAAGAEKKPAKKQPKASTADAATSAAGVRNYKAAAISAARWIRTTGIRAEPGMVWPVDPADPKKVQFDLYSGTPGVVLFFLELARATGDVSYLADARAGANALLEQVDHTQDAGLYSGVAGIGFVLHQVYLATKDPVYLKAAERAVDRVAGVTNADTTDIISGASGAGLFLLYAHREMQSQAALDAARRLGDSLLNAGRPEGEGTKWAMNATFPRLMPNFSHGTAGVAYFLAALYQRTTEQKYLDAALAGARYLQTVANPQCFVFHDEPDGKQLYYLGWCHGPVGTARLFYLLTEVTKDRSWRQWMLKSADSLMRTGVPEKRTPGFWNNVSQCCGSAGVAEFFLELHLQNPKRKDYLTFARRVANDALDRATEDEKGMRWRQAEHRTKPELLVAQTGYMQGAAGLGMMLLHLADPAKARAIRIVFPDSPYEQR